MSRLSLSEKIAGSADFQVPHGNPEPASELRKIPDRLQTFFRHFLEHLVASVHKERIRRSVGPSHSAPELVQL